MPQRVDPARLVDPGLVLGCLVNVRGSRARHHRPAAEITGEQPVPGTMPAPVLAKFLEQPLSAQRLMIERANHVWCADITYIPVRRGFLYLAAIMDWASRHVLAWHLSNTLDAGFCTDALDEALARHGTPEIFNTDQGSQFTGFAFSRALAGSRHPDLDGRQGPVPGQHLH